MWIRACTHSRTHTYKQPIGGDADTGPCMLPTQLCACMCECALCWLLSLWRDVESPGAWWWMGVLSLVRSSCLCAVFLRCVFPYYTASGACSVCPRSQRAGVGGLCVNVAWMKRFLTWEGVKMFTRPHVREQGVNTDNIWVAFMSHAHVWALHLCGRPIATGQCLLHQSKEPCPLHLHG